MVMLIDGLYLVNSTFGWLFSDHVNTDDNEDSDYSMFVEENVDMTKQFWELETIGIQSPSDETDTSKFRNNFNTTLRNEDGRYYVSWPWKLGKFELPNNYHLAKARLKSLVNNLHKDTMLHNEEVR